jgi:beta-N-acetylhexosaminidase
VALGSIVAAAAVVASRGTEGGAAEPVATRTSANMTPPPPTTPVASTPTVSAPPVTIATPPTAIATTTVPSPPVSTADCRPAQERSTEELARTVVMVGVDGSSIDEARLLTAPGSSVGGLFIGGNADRILSDGSLAALQASTGVIIAVDDEGGRVQRLDGLAGDLPSAAAMAALPSSSVRSLAADRGRRLRAAGVTVDFAPVADLADPGSGGVIGDRSYGLDPSVVIDHAGAFADGLRDAGVVPTFKHFPGHGAGAGDSHLGSVATAPLESLEQRDLVPFRALVARAPATDWVMMGHLDVPGLTEPGRPASLSPAAHAYLREQLGFSGLIVSDELGGMRAVSGRYGVGRAAVMALGAGTDVVLIARVDQVPTVVQAITAAVRGGELPRHRLEAAASRVREAQGC